MTDEHDARATTSMSFLSTFHPLAVETTPLLQMAVD